MLYRTFFYFQHKLNKHSESVLSLVDVRLTFFAYIFTLRNVYSLIKILTNESRDYLHLNVELLTTFNIFSVSFNRVDLFFKYNFVELCLKK